ncbi:hypothetical protein [Bradyrhizobium sp. Tv2a-2]|uniref:hypothetical protein n=1 Tax=Bradyrhizobium sp. Tv2a-2 TaxID=113395 RepID=UPI00040206EB|nr:hypothetical protein [Bradyrhizobium sp. Tv2a-2]
MMRPAKIALALAACLLLSADTMAANMSKWLPNHDRTPGAVNPDITQDNIGETICANSRGGHWSTKSIRPPASYTTKLKKKQLADWGYEDKNPRHYEEDHIISLEIGGAPRDPKNLFPQPYAGEWGARVKDKLEQRLNKLVCDGTLTLKEAQAAISSDWVAAYRKFVN